MKRELDRNATVDRARRLLSKRRDSEYLEFLETARRRFPGDAEVALLYAIALLPTRPDDVPWHIASAIQLEPENPWLLTEAAHVLFHRGELDAARDYAKQAARFVKHEFLAGDLLNLSGQLAAVDGDAPRAEEAFRLAIECTPSDTDFVVDLVDWLVANSRQDEAPHIIDEAMPRVREPERLAALRRQLTNPD